MAEIACPTCGKTNPDGVAACQFCGTSFQPAPGGAAIHPGEKPVKKATAEFEGVRPKPSDDDLIRPGDPPVKKKTSELEQALPSWLKNLRGHPDQPPEPAPDEPPAPAPAGEAERVEFPDWLAGLEDDKTRVEEEQVPDWLANLRGRMQEEGEVPPAASPPDTPAAPAVDDLPREEMPGWLSRLGDGEAVLKDAVARPAIHPDENARPLPRENTSPTGAGTDQPVPEARLPGEEPDWLSRLQPEADYLPLETAGEALMPGGGLAGTPTARPGEEIPDWLAAAAGVAAAEGSPASPGGPAGVTPALIAGGEESPARTDSSLPLESPDWLSTIKPEQAPAPGPAAETGDGQVDGSLEPAQLPTWVQAMRPVESVVAAAPLGESEELPAEEQGPLAGLRGVLPAAPGMGAFRKPPAYSIKLQASEDQARNAAQLERLVAGEGQRSELPEPSLLGPARILRWVVALLLLLAVLLPVASGMQVAPDLSGYPPEMVAARNVVQDPALVPVNAPVLIAFDYEPALAGELEAAAAPLIDNLLFTGARLALVSTIPSGPALAERFMLETQSFHQYTGGEEYVNLGYLAGGPAGILDFAIDPPAAAPVTPGGADAWSLPPLAGVRELGDFTLLIIVTDSADTGRAWIEQASSHLQGRPVLMVISAQAEPMLRPYYESGQVQGLVTGLAGGKAYEQSIQRPGLGTAYWTAFSAGLFISVLIILAGGIWSLAGEPGSRKPYRVTEKP
ncbi:MAG: hypothetical protein FJZ96_01350 [Chloroflexi bacterium]|nr:hypothetical protein [Chloroflexota bacterium]